MEVERPINMSMVHPVCNGKVLSNRDSTATSRVEFTSWMVTVLSQVRYVIAWTRLFDSGDKKKGTDLRYP